MRTIVGSMLMTLTLTLTMAVHAEGLLDGEKLFKSQCAACHSAVAGEPNRQGPNLFGVSGRAAGRAPLQVYSDGFSKALAGKIWTPSLMDKWLEDPQEVAPDSIMMYKQSDAQKREALIAYLKTLQEK